MYLVEPVFLCGYGITSSLQTTGAAYLSDADVLGRMWTDSSVSQTSVSDCYCLAACWKHVGEGLYLLVIWTLVVQIGVGDNLIWQFSKFLQLPFARALTVYEPVQEQNSI